MKSDTYQQVADAIIAALDAGVVPWRKPWNAPVGGALRNAITGRPYSGINTMILGMAMMARDYTDPRFLTFKQARAAGGSVRRGEHGTHIVFWRFIKGEADANGKARTIPMLRTFTVFNVTQVDGIAFPTVDTPATTWDAIAEAERVTSDYIAREGITFRQQESDRAYYVPARDTLVMPAREQFRTAEGYYSTLIHECGHSTGHTSRLGRFTGEAAIAKFGSADYGREELVAEFTSAFVSGAIGIACDAESAQNAAYIAGWRKAITADPRAVVVAAGKASHAADRILGVTAGEEAGEE